MENKNQISPEEEMIQLQLINNPAYDSDWIAFAARILAKESDNITEKDLAKLSASKLSLFNEILESDDHDKAISVIKTLLLHNDLNDTQMRLYWTGINKGLTENIMEQFLDASIPYAKSNYIIQAILDGFTGITEYIDFDAAQITEIYAGMKDGIDYKQYAMKMVPAEYMNLARHALCFPGVKLMTDFYDITTEDENEPVDAVE